MGTNPEKRNSNFLMQGVFLATASLTSRIIGLIYRVPLTAIIGKTGNDYYGTAFSIYNILLIISSYSLPLAISKLVATRMADNKVKDAKRVLDLGLIFALISGGSAALIVFFGADFFAGSLLKTANAAFALRILAPALLIVAFLGVFRGFFQGLGTMVPSAISQIVEQIVNAIVSIVCAYFLFKAGLKVSDKIAAAYGAGGGTLGTVSGAFIALCFLLIVFFLYRKRLKRRILKDKSQDRESYSSLLIVLFLTIIPVLLSTTLYNISSILNQGIYKNLALSSGYDGNIVSDYWGVYVGQVNVLINIPLAIANSIAASIVPSLAASYKRKELNSVSSKVGLGLRFINIISFPCMAGLFVLSGPIMILLFKDDVASSGYMLMLASISVIFYSVSTLTNGILQGIDRMKTPVFHAGISLILQAILLVILMKYFNLSIYAVIISNIFYAFLMCVLNELSVKKAIGLEYSFINIYIKPLISSVIMGLGVFIFYNLLYTLTEINTVSTLVSIVFGVIIYLIVMMLFKSITGSDLLKIPGGRIIVKISKKLRLID